MQQKVAHFIHSFLCLDYTLFLSFSKFSEHITFSEYPGVSQIFILCICCNIALYANIAVDVVDLYL
jgi:hypothetical protein